MRQDDINPQVCPPGQSAGTNSAYPFSAVHKCTHDRFVQDQAAVQVASGQRSQSHALWQDPAI